MMKAAVVDFYTVLYTELHQWRPGVEINLWEA